MSDRDNITLPREVVEKALRRAFHLGQNYWYEANRDSGAAHKRADKYRQDFDAMCSDVLARAALAAEQPKPEPVAWQERRFFPKVDEWTHWYDCRPRMADYPREQIEQNGVRYQWRPLYAAPPDAPTVKESLTHPGYIIGSHWLETAYSRICAGEAEADVLRDCGWERVDQALRRDAEKWRKAQAKYIAWQKGGKAEAMEGT